MSQDEDTHSRRQNPWLGIATLAMSIARFLLDLWHARYPGREKRLPHHPVGAAPPPTLESHRFTAPVRTKILEENGNSHTPTDADVVPRTRPPPQCQPHTSA